MHHSDRGVQYLWIRYSERLAPKAPPPPWGLGRPYVNAMAESINASYKADPITMQGPWRNVDDVELATLGRVHGWNHRRLLASIGDIPPVQFETLWTTPEPAHTTDHHDARPGVLTLARGLYATRVAGTVRNFV